MSLAGRPKNSSKLRVAALSVAMSLGLGACDGPQEAQEIPAVSRVAPPLLGVSRLECATPSGIEVSEAVMKVRGEVGSATNKTNEDSKSTSMQKEASDPSDIPEAIISNNSAVLNELENNQWLNSSSFEDGEFVLRMKDNVSISKLGEVGYIPVNDKNLRLKDVDKLELINIEPEATKIEIDGKTYNIKKAEKNVAISIKIDGERIIFVLQKGEKVSHIRNRGERKGEISWGINQIQPEVQAHLNQEAAMDDFQRSISNPE